MHHLPRPIDGQTWVQALEASHDFWLMPKAKRRSWRRQAEHLDEVGNQPIETPPETKFVVPKGMTPEEATRLKIEEDAKKWPVETVTHEKQRRSFVERIRRPFLFQFKILPERTRDDYTPAPASRGRRFDRIFIGPRGGRYRINKNGRKSYDVP